MITEAGFANHQETPQAAHGAAMRRNTENACWLTRIHGTVCDCGTPLDLKPHRGELPRSDLADWK